jgi:hypothetical protein
MIMVIAAELQLPVAASQHMAAAQEPALQITQNM